eukprot:scaffold341185_cov28-Prasinocladus_malaysianus.AAC.1
MFSIKRMTQSSRPYVLKILNVRDSDRLHPAFRKAILRATMPTCLRGLNLPCMADKAESAHYYASFAAILSIACSGGAGNRVPR